MKSINPYTGLPGRDYTEHTDGEATVIVNLAEMAFQTWRHTDYQLRSRRMHRAAAILRARKDEFATLITEEMGKILGESQAEVEKCAAACDYFADHAEALLKDLPVESDALRSLVIFKPLGVILAVMPWNFPFWQVFRFAAPALMAGNAAVMKHASNVPGCALAIESVFREAGFPADLFRTLMISSNQVSPVIRHPAVAAVTLTGSEDAGSHVASEAARHIKKAVLELGGSDPFIVLEDADLEKAVATAVKARMINQGQSCIAAKRFFVAESRVADFETRIVKALQSLKSGDPADPTVQVGPLARRDLVEDLDRLVARSVEMGARLLLGGKPMEHTGYFYEPTVLTDVRPEMPVFMQETFGPVVAIIPVKDETMAIELANRSVFGLGGSVWTTDLERGEAVARKVETGAMFVNGLVKSDPRLPFGGIKKSGYGRELAEFGIREFVNIKTIWIGS